MTRRLTFSKSFAPKVFIFVYLNSIKTCSTETFHSEFILLKILFYCIINYIRKTSHSGKNGCGARTFDSFCKDFYDVIYCYFYLNLFDHFPIWSISDSNINWKSQFTISMHSRTVPFFNQGCRNSKYLNFRRSKSITESSLTIIDWRLLSVVNKCERNSRRNVVLQSYRVN